MKFQLKDKALNLRKKGYSLADISKKLGISESTASLWCTAIQLTTSQKQKLETRTNKKLGLFFAMVEKQKAVRLENKNKKIESASNKTSQLTKRDLLVAGVALYWAEGFKHISERRIGFCNSDPEMMKFMVLFLKSYFKVNTEALSPRLTINFSAKVKTNQIEKFWSDYLDIPLSQFTKPFYQKTANVKIFNDQENYHGVLRLHVKKSSELMTQMRGLIEGFKRFSRGNI